MPTKVPRRAGFQKSQRCEKEIPVKKVLNVTISYTSLAYFQFFFDWMSHFVLNTQ